MRNHVIFNLAGIVQCVHDVDDVFIVRTIARRSAVRVFLFLHSLANSGRISGLIDSAKLECGWIPASDYNVSADRR